MFFGAASRPTTRSSAPTRNCSSSTAFSPVTILIAAPVFSSRNRFMARGITRAETVGSAPTRIGWRLIAPSWRTESTPRLSADIAEPAWPRKISPSRVTRMPRPSRSTTAMPSAFSSSRNVLVTAGALTCRKSAARATLPCRATSRNVCKWRKRIRLSAMVR